MTLKSIITFALLVISVVSGSDNVTEEVVPVPPFNYTKPPFSVKIVGGSQARDHQFPWQASITSCVGSSCSLCGGSLISTRHILTAAHCTKGKSSFDIGLGSNTRNKPAVTVTSRVKVVHPSYNEQTFTNDVAIIKLPNRVAMNSYVQTIVLASSSIGSLANKDAIVSGYGRTSSNGPSSNSLKFVDMKIISNSQCRLTYKTSIKSSTLCATGKQYLSDNPCQGDSGGPLVIKQGSSYVQVGVVSFVSTRGCEVGHPSGYARVSAFHTWISQNTN